MSQDHVSLTALFHPTIVNNFDACGGTIDITFGLLFTGLRLVPPYTASIIVRSGSDSPTWGTLQPSIYRSQEAMGIIHGALICSIPIVKQGLVWIDGTVSPTIDDDHDACGGTIDITWPRTSLASGSPVNYTASIPQTPAPLPAPGVTTQPFPQASLCQCRLFTAPDLTDPDSEVVAAGRWNSRWIDCIKLRCLWRHPSDYTWPAPSLARHYRRLYGVHTGRSFNSIPGQPHQLPASLTLQTQLLYGTLI